MQHLATDREWYACDVVQVWAWGAGGWPGGPVPGLGMSENANYQSNLDGREVDVCRELLEVLHDGEESAAELHFLQIYTDSPHMHRKHPYKHPVSGVVTCCDMVHHDAVPQMYSRARVYVEHMVDLRLHLL